jgi:hypothetical protein
MNAATPFTRSAELLASMRPPALTPTVPEMVRRLAQTRADRIAFQMAALWASDDRSERLAADAAAACDDREAILRTAIVAAVDFELERIGVTFAELLEMGL